MRQHEVGSSGVHNANVLTLGFLFRMETPRLVRRQENWRHCCRLLSRKKRSKSILVTIKGDHHMNIRSTEIDTKQTTLGLMTIAVMPRNERLATSTIVETLAVSWGMHRASQSEVVVSVESLTTV